MTAARLILFDLDGTLVHSIRAIVAGMTAAFAAADRPPPSETAVRGIVGLSLPVAMARLAPDLPDPVRARMIEAYRATFAGLRLAGGPEAAAPLFPGARAALDRLARGGRGALGIATGKGRPGLAHVLAAHGLAAHFVTTQTGDVHPSKPHPAMIRTALAETGAAPERAVMIGDTDFDMMMGRAAGVATIAVSWGYHPRDRLLAAKPDAIIDRFADLDAALDRLGFAP